jgi:hypothetical protein
MPGAFVEEAMEKKKRPWYGNRKPELPDSITFRVDGSLPQMVVHLTLKIQGLLDGCSGYN